MATFVPLALAIGPARPAGAGLSSSVTAVTAVAAAPVLAPGGPAPPAPTSASDSAAAAERADREISERLLAQGGGLRWEAETLMGLAWNPQETPAAREAALRRLRSTQPRLVVDLVATRIATSPPAVQVGMLQLAGEVFTRIGGVDQHLNTTLADRIHSTNVDVAREAITVCSDHRIKEAYLPMREIASRPESPLRQHAIAGLAKLADARAVGFFTQLLEDPAVSRDELYSALALIGRPSALFLKSRLEDPDPAERRRALDGVLRIAAAEDLTALYAYIRKYPPEGELKKQVYEKIAALEAQQFQRAPED